MVTKIFSVSISNDRVDTLLDNTIIRKEKKTHRAIEHSFRAEFIALFISVAESLVRFGHTLPGLGYMAHVTSSEMETAREVIDKHISSIATKCWLRVKMEALKKPHKQNTLFQPTVLFYGCRSDASKWILTRLRCLASTPSHRCIRAGFSGSISRGCGRGGNFFVNRGRGGAGCQRAPDGCGEGAIGLSYVAANQATLAVGLPETIEERGGAIIASTQARVIQKTLLSMCKS